MKVHRGLLFVIGIAALVAMVFWFFGQTSPPLNP